MPDLEETHVVTCFLRHRGEVLLLRRSGEVGSYRGRWGGVAGHAEGEPDEAARREIAEETRLGEAVKQVRRGEPFDVEDAELGKRWVVHPYLFDCNRRAVELDWEALEAEWVAPTEILRRDTVPDLWTSYARVAPTVEQVAGDRQHGSAWISLRALEVLRDRAGRRAWELERGEAAAGEVERELRELAGALLDARPAMAALANRVHRALHACREDAGTQGYAAAVEERAHAAIAAALDADAAAARHAGELAAGRRVLTLSRSGTVLAALSGGPSPAEVWVAVSAPEGEGVGMAEELAAAGLDVVLLPDAAIASALTEGLVDLVLLGADTVLPDGTVVNKTGSLPAGLAARRAGVPLYAVAAADKVDPAGELHTEVGDPGDLYAGDAELTLFHPLFEPVPPDLVTGGLVTEVGVVEAGEVAGLAEELARLRTWRG